MDYKDMIEIVKQTEFNDDIRNDKIIKNGKQAVIDILNDEKVFFSNNDKNVYEFIDTGEFEADHWLDYIEKYMPDFGGYTEAWSRYFSLLREVYYQCFTMIKCDLEDDIYNKNNEVQK